MTPIRGMTPLVVFLMLGFGVFALDRWVDAGSTPRGTIEVTEQQLAGISERWAVQWGRSPTVSELRGLVDDAVKEEVLYREALRLGLDRGDTIVRRRLAQKMTFMLEDGGAVPVATESEIAAYHAMHAGRYREPNRTTFRHVFLSNERRVDPAGDARALLDDLGIPGDDRWRQLGDPFMLLREYAERTDQEITDLFGRQFAAALAALDAGDWHGPIPSAYGTHLVRVSSRTNSSVPTVGEVRDRVVADLAADRRRERNQSAFEALRERYEVRMPAGHVAGQP